MNLRVNGSVNLTEGEVGEICVTVDDHERSRERVIPISISSVLNSATIGMFTLLALSLHKYFLTYGLQMKVTST